MTSKDVTSILAFDKNPVSAKGVLNRGAWRGYREETLQPPFSALGVTTASGHMSREKDLGHKQLPL